MASEPAAEFRLTHLGVIPEDQGSGWDVIAWEFSDFTAYIGHCKLKLACSIIRKDGHVMRLPLTRISIWPAAAARRAATMSKRAKKPRRTMLRLPDLDQSEAASLTA